MMIAFLLRRRSVVALGLGLTSLLKEAFDHDGDEHFMETLESVLAIRRW